MFGSMFDSMIDVRFLRSPGLDLASTLDSSNRLLDYVSMAPASQIGYSIFDPKGPVGHDRKSIRHLKVDFMFRFKSKKIGFPRIS